MCTVIIKSFVCQMSWGEGWHFVLLINDSLPFLSCKVSYSFSHYSVSTPQWAYNKCEELTHGCRCETMCNKGCVNVQHVINALPLRLEQQFPIN